MGSVFNIKRDVLRCSSSANIDSCDNSICPTTVYIFSYRAWPKPADNQPDRTLLMDSLQIEEPFPRHSAVYVGRAESCR